MREGDQVTEKVERHALVVRAGLCAGSFVTGVTIVYFLAVYPLQMALEECHRQLAGCRMELVDCHNQLAECVAQLAECRQQKDELATQVAEWQATAYALMTPTTSTGDTYHTSVSASTFPFANTNVSIEEGDDVRIIVQGPDPNWDCGKGATSPEGIFGDRWDGHIDASANQCELVGYVREGVPFRIGAYEEFVATEPGSLYLGANDDPAQMVDNSGALEVDIIVTR